MNLFSNILILLSSQLFTLAHEFLTRQPFGIKMCEDGKLHVDGMKSFRFQVIQLSCHLTDEVCPDNIREQTFCEMVHEVKHACSRGSKIVKSRRNTIICAKVSVAKEDQTDMETIEKKPHPDVKMFLYRNSLPNIKKVKSDDSPNEILVYGIKNTKKFHTLTVTHWGTTTPPEKRTTSKAIINMIYFIEGHVLYWTTSQLRVRTFSLRYDKYLMKSVLVLDVTQVEGVVAYVLGRKSSERNRLNGTWYVWTIDSMMHRSVLGYIKESISQIAVPTKGSRIYLSNKKQYILNIDVKRNSTGQINTKFHVQTLMIDKKNDVLYYASKNEIIRVDTKETVFRVSETIYSLHYIKNAIFILTRRGQNNFIKGYKHKDMKINRTEFRYLEKSKTLFLS